MTNFGIACAIFFVLGIIFDYPAIKELQMSNLNFIDVIKCVFGITAVLTLDDIREHLEKIAANSKK